MATRVLVVDDSRFFRHRIVDILQQDTDIELGFQFVAEVLAWLTHQVGKQVEQYDQRRIEGDHTEHERIVAVQCALDKIAPQTR